jgi:hypothetical protein
MDFNTLPDTTKASLHEAFVNAANSVGGQNFFLKMIEDVRAEKPNPLLNKSGSFHYSKGRISLSKSLFKETFSLLFDAIRREEKKGDMLNGIEPKEYKAVMNMMRALSKTTITVTPKDEAHGTGFSFTILDTSAQKQTKVTFMFKAIFFYHLDEAKKALKYETK